MNDTILNDILNRAVSSHSENGASLAVTKDGRSVCALSAGLADVENRIPFSGNTICRAFSCTKVVTGTAAMILMERGRLDLNWELSWFFPEYRDAFFIRDGVRKTGAPIRLRDLMNMTSGIAYPGGGYEGCEGMNELWWRLDQSVQSGSSMTTAQFAAEAGKQPLAFEPGDRWQYGSSADVMGAVIEKLADMRYSDFLKENIFSPLGMEDTAFYVPAEKRDRLAVLYENAGEQPKKPEYVNLCIYDYDTEPAFQSGGAGLFSTAADYSKLGAELSSGGAGVISRRAVDFMRENGLTDAQRAGYDWDSVRGYGYGNLVRCLESRNQAGTFASKGAFGWDGWTGTYLLCDPEERLSVTVFLQRCGAGTTQLSRDLVNAVYASL